MIHFFYQASESHQMTEVHDRVWAAQVMRFSATVHRERGFRVFEDMYGGRLTVRFDRSGK